MKIVMMGLYPQDKNKIPGGVHAVTWRLADALSKLPDVEMYAITMVPGLKKAYENRCGNVQEYYLPTYKRLGRFNFFIPDSHRVNKILRKIKPDIIHVHGSVEYPATVWRSGIPWVMTPHGMRIVEAKIGKGLAPILKALIDGWYERFFYRRATDIIASSKYVIPFITPYTEANIYESPNALDENYFNIQTKEVPGTILFIGAFIERKGVMFLLQAMKLLKDRRAKCKIFLVGDSRDPGYESEMRKFISDNDLKDYVEWLGKVPEERVLELYGECSCYVLTSLEETLPTVIAQAMAAGKPVIGTRSAGTPFMVREGETGLLVDYGDSVGLADKIEYLLNNPEVRKSCGEAARKIACSDYFGPNVARHHLEIYQGIIERSKKDESSK